MKALKGYYIKGPVIQVILTIVLLAIVLVTTYLIVRSGEKMGIIVVGAIIGGTVIIYSFINPFFGFCAATFSGFIGFNFERLLMTKGSGAIAESIVYVSFLGVIFNKVLKREVLWTNKWHIVSLLFILQLLYIAGELLNTNAHSLEGNLIYLRDFLKQVVVYFVAINLFTNQKKIKIYFNLWIVLMVLCASYACFQQWFGLRDFEKRTINSLDILIQLYRLNNGDYRKFGSLSDPPSLGIAASVSALFVIAQISSLKLVVKKILYFFAAVLMILAMAYSGTRTATFILIAGVFLYILATINNIKTLIFAAISTMLVVALLFGPFYGNVTLNRFKSTFKSDDASLNVRDINRARIQPYIYSHPFGGGLSTVGTNGATYNPDHFFNGFPPDSGLLKFALETGWIGLILVGITYCVILKIAVKGYFNAKSEFSSRYLLAFLLSVFAFVVAQYSQVAIMQIPGVFFFYGAVAAIVRITQFDKNLYKAKT